MVTTRDCAAVASPVPLYIESRYMPLRKGRNSAHVPETCGIARNHSLPPFVLIFLNT
jgi:hypothetical protein